MSERVGPADEPHGKIYVRLTRGLYQEAPGDHRPADRRVAGGGADQAIRDIQASLQNDCGRWPTNATEVWSDASAGKRLPAILPQDRPRLNRLEMRADLAPRPGQRARVEPAFDQLAGHVAEPAVVVPGVGAEPNERRVHVDLG